MRRFDLQCSKCKRDTVLYLQEEAAADFSEFPCSHCGHDQTELQAFYNDNDQQIIAMQDDIDKLLKVIDMLLEKTGITAELDAKLKNKRLH